MTNAFEPRMDPHAPPRREHFEQAARKAVEALGAQDAAQLRRLGAEPEPDGAGWRVKVLGETVHVDLAAGRCTADEGRPLRPAARVLVLHYLAARATRSAGPPEVTFPELLEGFTYTPVYRARVNERLCGTAGRDAETLAAAAGALGARRVEGGDLAFEVDVFPRVRLGVVWYAADEELPPAATVLLPRDIREYFSVEDVVVLSECLVARLGGRPL